MIELLNIDNMKYMTTQLDNVFDLAIVDPPYFNGPNKLGYYGANISSTGVIRKGYKAIGRWNLPNQQYFTELKRISKHQIIWGMNYYSIKNLGAGRIVWDKCNGTSSFSDCEIAYCSMHDSVRMFKYMWNGFCQGKNIFEGHIQQGNKRLNEKRIHPCQKPIKLYEWILTKYAKEGWKILDTHTGSASLAIACHNLDFSLVGCEIDKEYFKNGKERYRNHIKQLQLFKKEKF